MKMRKIRQVMAMFLCVLMVTKLAVPVMATASDSNAQSEEETPHIILNTEAGLYEPESSTQESTEESEPESSAQDSTEESELESSAQESTEESEPENSAQELTEESEPESSAQELTEESEPESSTQESTEGEEPESSAQDSTEETEPESSAQDSTEETESESSAQDQPEEKEEETASPTNATCQDCGMEPCECEICEICGEKNCKEHVMDVIISTIDTPQEGDIIWIIAGSSVYKNTKDEKGYVLKNNYEVKIVKIIVDENNTPIWYKFEFNDWGLGEAGLAVFGYNYVRAEDISTEELDPIGPTDEYACNCGENAPENLADHADSCPRKQYVRTLFEGKSAKEIYAEWENYDEAIQTDLLNMLQRWDNTKYEELKKLMEGACSSATTEDGVTIAVSGDDLPDFVSLEIGNVAENQYHGELDSYLDENSELLYVYDITLKNPDGSEWQPGEGQSIAITLDFNGMGLSDGNRINVLHEHREELRDLGDYEIEDGKLTFSTDGFSKFYFYITYEFGGYQFTMSGNEEIYLSELMQGLHLKDSIENVQNVEFTNPEVLEITEVDDDWLLKSLAPFGSMETLTLGFFDGEVIEITVKDPVVYNYAIGSEITNVKELETTDITMGAVTNGDTSSQGKKYKVNSAQITKENIQQHGTTSETATTTHMVIYVEEGMAVRFQADTDWPADTSRPKKGTNGVWYWSWDGTYNYVVVEENSSGKQNSFVVTTTIDNKKYYCNIIVCVVEESEPVLLEEALKKSSLSELSIRDVPVTLYNYDGKEWNEHYNAKSGNYFAFSGVVKGVDSTEDAGNRGWTQSGLQANGGGGVALMGIVKNQLEKNGLPVMSQGQNVDLFSNDKVPGKTIYPDVKFQFVYNENTGYYTYNSALNHAQYNEEAKEIQLYKQSLAQSDTPNGTSHGNGGFYPFTDIREAYTNTGYKDIGWSEWQEKLEENEFELIPSEYSSDIVQTSSKNPASTGELHYGIQVASDFYLPEGKQLNGNDMIYEFTGDDDLWVFIDGKLVLDIGGGHTYVSGSFNMTTGEVWVEKYTKLAAADGGSYSKREQGTDLRYTDSFLTSLEDDQMHTIQIFYLERHAGVSNCRMRFNLPLVPSDAVNVSKNLTNQDGEKLSVTPDVGYTFTLYTAEGNDDIVDATSFSKHAKEPYTVTGSGAPTGTQYTDEDGKFVLKDGWIASFSGIPRFTEVYVTESKPEDGYIYSDSTVSVNKEDPTKYEFDTKTETKVMQLNTSINFDFVNKMKTQPLTVEKQVVNGTAGLIDPEQKFAFTLDFTPRILESGEGAILATNKTDETVALTDNKAFSLGHDESVTIPRVPVNMEFTLMETNPDQKNNSFDAPEFEYETCTVVNTGVTETKPNAFDTAYSWKMGDGAENKITVTNQQRFDLTITKEGISAIDHHNASGTENEERQSTLYKVIGKIDDKVITEMKVAICGNDSVTICRLPVGSYTVVEDEHWSWRYEPDSPEKDVIIPDDAKASVTYTNTRNMPYWLSGDSYCKNWWGDKTGTVVAKREDDE